MFSCNTPQRSVEFKSIHRLNQALCGGEGPIAQVTASVGTLRPAHSMSTLRMRKGARRDQRPACARSAFQNFHGPTDAIAQLAVP